MYLSYIKSVQGNYQGTGNIHKVPGNTWYIYIVK